MKRVISAAGRAIPAGAPERGCWRVAGRGHRRLGTRAIAELNEAEAQISRAGDQLTGDPEGWPLLKTDYIAFEPLPANIALKWGNCQRYMLAWPANTHWMINLVSWQLAAAAENAKAAYQEKAGELSDKRRLIANDIDQQVMAELPPLKLEAAQFKTMDITK